MWGVHPTDGAWQNFGGEWVFLGRYESILVEKHKDALSEVFVKIKKSDAVSK